MNRLNVDDVSHHKKMDNETDKTKTMKLLFALSCVTSYVLGGN